MFIWSPALYLGPPFNCNNLTLKSLEASDTISDKLLVVTVDSTDGSESVESVPAKNSLAGFKEWYPSAAHQGVGSLL